MAKRKTKAYKDVPVKELKERFAESKEARKKYETLWDKARDFYDGKQWAPGSKIAWYQSDPVFNKVAEYVEIMRGYLSDNKWGVDAVPYIVPEGTDPEQLMQHADNVNSLLDFLWDDNRMQNKLAQVLQYVFLYGTGFVKTTFDPDNIGDGGIGQIETAVLSPWYIFPDPDATDVHDASYIIEHHPVSMRWIIERYPDKVQEVRDSGEASETEYSERKGDQARGPVNSSEGKRVDVLECWYRDSSIIEDQEGEPEFKYPNGRRTLMTKGGVVLEDGPCLYSMWPYVRFIEIPRPAEFFGDCTVHKALGIQETINTILRSIIDNGLWLIHGIWVVDSTSGITPKTLAGYGPRSTLVKNPGTEVRRDSGAPLPSHVFETLNQQVEAFDRVVGLPDVLRGIVPSRQPVQTVMMQQESGEVRTRERQRRVEESLADLGRLWVDIVAEHWNDKRTIRNRKALGGFDMFDISKEDFEDWRWDIHIVPGSTAPMDKNSMMSMMSEAMNNMGVQIPPNFIVRLMGVPGLEAAVLEQDMQIMGAEEEAPMPEGEMPPEGEIDEPFDAPLPDGMLPPEMAPDMGMPPMPPDAAMGMGGIDPAMLDGLSPEEIDLIMASMGGPPPFG